MYSRARHLTNFQWNACVLNTLCARGNVIVSLRLILYIVRKCSYKHTQPLCGKRKLSLFSSKEVVAIFMKRNGWERWVDTVCMRKNNAHLASVILLSRQGSFDTLHNTHLYIVNTWTTSKCLIRLETTWLVGRFECTISHRAFRQNNSYHNVQIKSTNFESHTFIYLLNLSTDLFFFCIRPLW